MEENKREDCGGMDADRRAEEYGGDVKISTPLIKKIENFWYHYKWHSIAALFLVIAILVCSLQMCARVEVDFHLLYAGGTEISRRSEGGDIPVYNQLTGAVGAYVSDVDGDGKKNVSLTTYFALSPDEIKEIEESDGVEVNYQLLASDAEAMRTRFSVGEYYLCLVSPYVYGQYRGSEGSPLFTSLAPYVPEGVEVEYYSDSAIKLSSTKFWQDNPIVREALPEDTLLVLRTKGAAGGVLGNAKENERNFNRAADALRAMLGGE